jgi:hypothetical protein
MNKVTAKPQQKHLNLQMLKRSKESKFWGGESILLALRITFEGIVENTTEYFQERFYNDGGDFISSSGHFMYLPFEKKDQSESFFVNNTALKENPDSDESKAYAKLLADIYKSRVSVVDGDTVIEIMISCNVSENIRDELQAFNTELEELVDKNIALSWEQIDLFA